MGAIVLGTLGIWPELFQTFFADTRQIMLLLAHRSYLTAMQTPFSMPLCLAQLFSILAQAQA